MYHPERHLGLLLKVRERGHHIFRRVRHLAHPGSRRNERSLKSYGNQHYTEYYTENIIGKFHLRRQNHNRKHDGRGSSQAHERHQGQLRCRILPERHKNSAYGKRTCHKCKEKENQKSRDQSLEQSGRHRQHTEQEENYDLHKGSDGIKESHKGLFTFVLYISQVNTYNISA